MSTEKPSHKQLVEKVLNSPSVRAQVESNPRVARARRLYADSAQGLLLELSHLGFEVTNMRGLEAYGDYRAAVPVLLRWLTRISYLPLAEDIVHVVSVGRFKDLVVPELLKLFRDPPKVRRLTSSGSWVDATEQLRGTLGHNLSKFAGPALSDDLIALALERKYGTARSSIVSALPRTRNPRARKVLQDLIDDPSVGALAVKALGKHPEIP
jgi:hypothetical protein